MTPTDKRRRFAELHACDGVFVLPNPWDLGSAKMLAHAGFEALATTSSGLAWSLGTTDCGLSRDVLVDHVAALAAATDLPVTVDSERCFSDGTAGARRFSTGGALASMAYGRLARAAHELLDEGTMTFVRDGLRADDRRAFA